MSKSKKHILAFEEEIDFEMIGVCSHHSDYRLDWGINDLLKYKLVKSDDEYIVTNKKGEPVSSHSMYTFYDEENRIDFYLIKNKVEGKFLIPEKSAIDYFLFLCNNTSIELLDIVQQLKLVPSVLAAYPFYPEEISSTQNLAFN